jgi:peptidylprolyl isomerase
VTHRTLTLLALLLVLALAACGGGDEETAATPEPAATQEAPTPEATAEALDNKDLSAKPVVERPTGDPPKTLKVKDMVKGDGTRAKKGDDVTVQYVGVAFSTGQQFDASWDSGQPFSFPLGAGKVIPGWDEGVAGMRVGGRRQLTIPPDQAYGTAGAPPAIGPNETLIFIVDLVDVA